MESGRVYRKGIGVEMTKFELTQKLLSVLGIIEYDEEYEYSEVDVSDLLVEEGLHSLLTTEEWG